MSPEEVRLYSTFRPHADLSLATVIHSLAAFLFFTELLEGTYVSVSYGLLRSPYWSCRHTMRQAFASEILTLPLH
jgi:hypothetical protein